MFVQTRVLAFINIIQPVAKALVSMKYLRIGFSIVFDNDSERSTVTFLVVLVQNERKFDINVIKNVSFLLQRLQLLKLRCTICTMLAE